MSLIELEAFGKMERALTPDHVQAIADEYKKYGWYPAIQKRAKTIIANLKKEATHA